MRISDLARHTGLTSRMLRYYEQQGLLHPQRSGNGYREYTKSDIDRAKMIRDLVNSSVPTRVIATVLEQHDSRNGHWTSTCDHIFADKLASDIEDLDSRIECLTRSRNALEDLRQHAQLPLRPSSGRPERSNSSAQ